jgi:hypothetical protein
MTDFDPDELVSAVLDGEATGDERARVEADPALSARLAELRMVRDALAAPTPVPSERERDAAIAAAIRSAPVDLQQRRRNRQRLTQIASIAAAILVFAVVVAGIAALSRHDSNNRAASSAAAASSSPTGSEAAAGAVSPSTESADAAGAPSPPLSATAPVVADLGSFATRDALVTAVEQANAQFRQQTATPPAAASTEQSRSAADAGCASQAGARLFANAQLSGQPVIVVVTAAPNAEILHVYDATCVLLFSQPL